MQNPRETRTNAADTAPGLNDGPVGAGRSSVNSKPGGRRMVLWIGLAALVVLMIVMFARPQSTRDQVASTADEPTTAYSTAPTEAAPVQQR